MTEAAATSLALVGDTMTETATSTRPDTFDERYRLYVDESGDHVYRLMADSPHRFLCLLGCWFRNPDYVSFHQALEALKTRHFSHHPDDPAVLHREDMLNARRAFKVLRDDERRKAFDADLLEVIAAANFRVVAVVMDKFALWRDYGDAAFHPYHIGLAFLLQRYAGYLNHISRLGDVMAEARGGKEDRLLSNAYTNIYDNGAWMTPSHVFHAALTSREIKLRQKKANIAGLQLADLLGHPIKQWVLWRYGLLEQPLSPFAERLLGVAEPKFNHHLYDGRVEGYGIVLYPKK